MKIHDALYDKIKSLEQDKIVSAQKANKGDSQKTAAEGDQISLSQQGRELARAAEEAKKSDGVRTERVEELKRRIDAGDYTPDSREIAGKMIQNDLDLWS
ncbi:MAG: flagellar biosynthesis anti-sigma factor FlgM [Desulfovibrionales bacterium]